MAKQRVESNKVRDVKEKKQQYFTKKLQVLFKKAAQARAPTSWMLLRGKERRKNIIDIMHAMERGYHIADPSSIEQLTALKQALEEICETTMTLKGSMESNKVSDCDTSTRGTNGDRCDDQSVLFYFGNDYGNQAFLDLAKELESGEQLNFCLYGDIVRGTGLNTGIGDSSYLTEDVMQLLSVEDMLNELSKEKLI